MLKAVDLFAVWFIMVGMLMLLSMGLARAMEFEEIAVRLATKQCVPAYKMYCKKGKANEAFKANRNSK